MALSLHYRDLDDDQPGCPLIMLHGLFGSAANLQSVARQLAKKRRVILPDLRNHGRSPHADEVSYEAMSADVLALMQSLDCQQVDLLGHSMGGKVAMWLALNYPWRVNHLVVADIAPVTYSNRFSVILTALQQLELEELNNRQQAEEQLARHLQDSALSRYLLQNLLMSEGKWQWRINLPAIAAGIDNIMAFPSTSEEYEKPALFLRGARSDYISADQAEMLYRFFPMAQLETIENAGHWLYAEQPQQFAAAIERFLPENTG